MKSKKKEQALAILPTALAWPISTARADMPDTDVHPPQTNYDAVVVEHADFIPFGPDGFAGYLTIWNGTRSEKIIRSIDVEPIGTAELAKRVSADVTRSMLGTSVISIPPKSELHMDADTMFLVVVGSTSTEPTKVIVRFDDGSTSTARGRFVREEAFLTDHHHPSKPKP